MLLLPRGCIGGFAGFSINLFVYGLGGSVSHLIRCCFLGGFEMGHCDCLLTCSRKR